MKRLVINLNNAEEMKKSYTSPLSLVINVDATIFMAGSNGGSMEQDDPTQDQDKMDDDLD